MDSMVSSIAVYSYQETTYQIQLRVPACVIIVSTVYSGVVLPYLATSALAVFN